MPPAMSKGKFLTEDRRDFIQRTMLNIFSITLAAGYASNFFTACPLPAKIIFGVGSLGAWLVGFLVSKKGEKNVTS